MSFHARIISFTYSETYSETCIAVGYVMERTTDSKRTYQETIRMTSSNGGRIGDEELKKIPEDRNTACQKYNIKLLSSSKLRVRKTNGHQLLIDCR